MSLLDVTLPKDYRNGRTLFEANLNSWRTRAQAGFANVNLNLTQLAKDLFSTGYDFDNDGLANKTTSLEDRINLLSAGGAPIAGTSNSTWSYNTGGNTVTLSASLLTTSRTFQYPDAAGTLVLNDNTATLTNKTFSGGTITSSTLTTPQFVDSGYIADSNGNELLEFGVVGSAVNHIKITNAATGNGSIISAFGGDTDVDLLINPQAAGHVIIKGATPVFSNGGDSGAGTITLDLSTENILRVHQTGAFTLAISNEENGQYGEVWIEADGSNGITWPTKFRWMNATGATNSTTDAPDPTAWTADKYYVIHFRYFSSEDLFYAWVSEKGAIT